LGITYVDCASYALTSATLRRTYIDRALATDYEDVNGAPKKSGYSQQEHNRNTDLPDREGVEYSIGKKDRHNE
jgi:hypothetical protein